MEINAGKNKTVHMPESMHIQPFNSELVGVDRQIYIHME